MTIRKLLVGSAVTAALASGSALALPPGTTYNVILYAAGSSAFQASFKTEFTNKVCLGGAVDTYQMNGNAPNMQAYSCQVVGAGGPFAAGQKVLAHYRAEGGSVLGIGPIQKNIPAYFVDPNSQASGVFLCTGGPGTYNCANPGGYSLATDSFAAGNLGAAKHAVQLGISDLEPGKPFTGDNWPNGTFLGAQPANFNNVLTPTAVVAQVFSFYMSSFFDAAHTRPVPANLCLTKQAIAGILSGITTTWDHVSNCAGTGAVDAAADPINTCLRDIGSGTRAGAGIEVLGPSCQDGPPQATALPLNNTTGAEVSCLTAAATGGRFGYAVQQAGVPAGTVQIALDGQLPAGGGSLVGNAAIGGYDYWFEATFNGSAALNGDANALTLANFLQGDFQNVGTLPNNSANLMALPTFNTPVLPVGAAQTVALGSRQGDSCQPANSFF